MGEEPYYTVKDVMRLTGYSLRQIERFLAKGQLEEVDHQPHHQRKISQASVHAFLDTRGIRPVDDVEVLKAEQLKHKQATGEALIELAEIRTQFKEFQSWCRGKIAEIEERFRASGGQRSRGSAPKEPDGAIMMVDFAKEHSTTIGKLRGLAERNPTLATVIERPDAQQKKHKWMILPEQMAPMLAALEKRGFVYTPCTSCPHDDLD